MWCKGNELEGWGHGFIMGLGDKLIVLQLGRQSIGGRGGEGGKRH